MLTQRLGSSTQMDAAFIEDFIRIVKENPGSCDEVWLATAYGFPPLSVHREMAAALGETAEKLRGAGLRVSLQISNTIGHGQYMAARDCSGLVYDGSPVRNIVGPDGIVSRYTFCWNDPVMREYVKEEIAAYVREIRPHTVWIDDDLRSDNHAPVGYGCFCDDCMARFNRANGTSYTREELVHEINRGDTSVRRAFVAQMRDGIADFTYEVYKTIHEICPECYAGLQNGAHGYSGGDHVYIYEAMYRATGLEPKSRPGGGAYSDHNPLEFLSKADYLSCQNARLPASVREIRPEIESLPDVCYGKSIAGTCFETTLYLASGATAMSYAIMMNDYEDMDWHGEMLAAFARQRPYWERLARASQNTVRGGLTLCMGHEMWMRPLYDGEGDFAWSAEPVYTAEQFRPLGFGVTFDAVKNPVYLLHPGHVPMLTDEEIRHLLTCPVITSGDVLCALAARGFDSCFSASARPISTAQLYETFTDHPVNAAYTETEGGVVRRRWSQSFSYTAGQAIVDRDGTTEPLGYYASDSAQAVPEFPGEEHPFGCADAIVYTDAGARWAVFGHNPWNNTVSSRRRAQLLAAVDYISDGALTAWLDTPAKVQLLPREDSEGHLTAVSMVNLTVGPSAPLSLRLRNPALKPGQTTVLFCSMTEPPCHLPLLRVGDDYLVSVPPLDAWSIGTVFIADER
ncbi:MAG: hypothetical protein E7604_05420 [Ruminococcaceae bacterium]|nr:hypothetical protein [Oscillospiraceae bacterium]